MIEQFEKETGFYRTPKFKEYVDAGYKYFNQHDVELKEGEYYQSYSKWLESKNKELRADINNKLSPVSNLCELVKEYTTSNNQFDKIVLIEIEQVKISLEYFKHLNQ